MNTRAAWAGGWATAIIGHRGFPAARPENTVASVEAALGAGADLVEVDVRTTADGQLVLMHDATVDRTTGGHGAVSNLTLAQVRSLSAGGEPVPTLAEALAAVSRPFMVDYTDLPEALALLAFLADPDARRRILLTGGNVEGHALLRDAYPDLFMAFSAGRSPIDAAYWRDACRLRADYVNPHFASLRRRFVDRARTAGHGLSTWTVDRPEDMRRVLALGVDLLITNRPDLAARVRETAFTPNGEEA